MPDLHAYTCLDVMNRDMDTPTNELRVGCYFFVVSQGISFRFAEFFKIAFPKEIEPTSKFTITLKAVSSSIWMQ